MRQLFLALISLSVLNGCGKPLEIAENIPDSRCELRDSCTYSDVPGYQCQALRWEADLGDGAKLPESFYKGALCVITKEDYQYTPGCDSENPTQMCQTGGGFGGGAITMQPCCQLIQGPGPASVI